MHENILFTDEKLLTIEELYNNQNKKIYSQTSLEMCSEGAGRPSNLLRHGFVGGVPSGGDTSSFLLERGEIDIRVYQEDVLQEVVKQLNMTFFIGQKWVFQQDSVPAQKSRLLRSGCGGTIWPSSVLRIGFRGVQTSKPWTTKLWAVLDDMACRERHNSLESLRRSLVKEAAEIPLETERAATTEWPESLNACVEV